MVSFSCETCGDVLTKKKLDAHRGQCRGASFTCLDCHAHFEGSMYRSHTSCISEAQKYQGALYRPKSKQNLKHAAAAEHSQALVPRAAYVEDVPDVESGPLAIVDAPPSAPSPPPANVNVFDFLVPEGASTAQLPQLSDQDASKALPSPDDSRLLDDGKAEDNDTWYDIEEMPAEPMHFEHRDRAASYEPSLDGGYAYGAAPVPPSFERYDSYNHFSSASRHNPAYYTDPAYYTPAQPRREVSARGHHHHAREDSEAKKSGKRKRGQPEDIDVHASQALQPYGSGGAGGDVVMTDATPAAVAGLHSGLTGGLSRLMSSRNGFPPSPDFSGEGEVEASPLSPLKKPKHFGVEVRAPRGADDDLASKERDRDRGRSSRGKPVMKRKAPTSHIRVGFSTQQGRKERDRSSPSRHYRDGGGDGEHRYTRRRRRHRSSSPDEHVSGRRRELKAIEYKPQQTSPPRDPNSSALILRRQSGPVAVRRSDASAAVGGGALLRAEMFMGFVTKGPESERGCSINKALKRYHRERAGRGADDDDDISRRRRDEKADEEKELWKSLRLKRNDRGEIVLFF